VLAGYSLRAESMTQWRLPDRLNEISGLALDADGRLLPELAALAPPGERRMSANPHANGGHLLRDLRLPAIADHAVPVDRPGATTAEAT